MDKRLRNINREDDRLMRDRLYQRLASGDISLGDAIKVMRKISHLTQPEFARHRNISVDALRQIEAGTANPTLDTLNKIVSIFGLQVGFVPDRRVSEITPQEVDTS